MERSFSLIPFPAPDLPAIMIGGTISLEKKIISLHYIIAGDIGKILLPSISTRPSRKDELWHETCLELFLAIKDRPGYWEFNLSPSRDWNVYRMDAYRRLGFREEGTLQQLKVEIEKQARSFQLQTVIDLSRILPGKESMEIGLTAVIQTRSGSTSYWALSHPASQPDFHLRESFILGLAGDTRLSRQSAADG